MTYETYTVASDFMTIDLIIWRRFKRPMDGLLEKVIALNPAIADSGPILPIGTAIIIPIEDPSPRTRAQEPVRLWG